MQRLWASLLAFLLPCAAFAADGDKWIAFSETPAAVQKTVAARIGDGKVDQVQQSAENGEIVFEVDFTTHAGSEQDITVADDGTLLSIGVALADTPAAVQKTIQTKLPGWEIVGVNKDIADAEIAYDVTVSKAGHERSYTIAGNGVLSSAEVELAETPPAVQAAIKTQVGDGNVKFIEEDFDPDGNSFDVEAVTKDGGKSAFSVALDGRILSEEVNWEQIPPPARKTIREKIGDGKILWIDKSLSEKRAGVLPYEVQGRKAGKPFHFSVGPHGKFLGMDD